MNGPELKQCPFCGENPHTSTRHEDERVGYVHIAKVYCPGCSVAISMTDTRDKNGWAAKRDALKKAADAWNRRADLPPTDAEVMAHPTVRVLVNAFRDTKRIEAEWQLERTPPEFDPLDFVDLTDECWQANDRLLAALEAIAALDRK